MAFVRVKKVQQKEYGYLVENEWTSKGSRQKVKSYLGKIYRPERKNEMPLTIERNWSFAETVQKLVEWELNNHDIPSEISQTGNNFTAKGKSIVLALNEGFLCDHTLSQLLAFKPKGTYEEQVGMELANSLVEAGLLMPKEQFILLFEKVYKQ